MAADEPMRLASEFPAATRDQWLALVAKQLKRPIGDGDDPEAVLDKLRSTTYDGITIEPFYDPLTIAPTPDPGVPGHAPFVRGRTARGAEDVAWEMRQRVDAGRGRGAGADELEHGATALALDLTTASTIDVDLLDSLLDGVYLDLAAVSVDAGERWAQAAEALVAVAEVREVADALTGNLGADPIGWSASTGDQAKLATQLDDVVRWVHRTRESHPGLGVIAVDATRYHEAGASDAEELACALATAVEYARVLADAGEDPLQACATMELRIAATADQFTTIAKVRALRRLWSRVTEVLGDPEAAGRTRVHLATSAAMLTVYDPWVNILRGTIACFAAGVGGADSVTVLPYDHASGPSSELALRIARNTQSILAFESHLARVQDPAGGAPFVETLTAQLAEAAWQRFQTIEADGGMRAAIASGSVAATIADTWEARRKRLATRRDPITGVSEFPNIDEPAHPELIAPSSPPPGALPRHRYAEDLELIRARADRASGDGTARPTVFLAAIGDAAAFTARATFAKNLFEAGGVRTHVGDGGTDPTAIAAGFTASGAPIACLCSSDAVYAAHAVAMAEALTAAGARAVYLAGRPQDVLDALAAVGVTRTITAGGDVEATLAELLDLLEVP